MIKTINRIKKTLTDQRGAVAILVAISMFVLLGFGAFAIDFGYSYVIKNELQNAADAAALGGASVLFRDNELCLAAGRPYACCGGSKTGTCDVATIDTKDVTDTARAVAAKNKSGGEQVPVPTVEVGHYAFASTRSQPGDFTPNPTNLNPDITVSQLAGWVTKSFSELNPDTGFINAVRVTLTRTNVPRFLSRIWGNSDLAITVQAVAYVGFAGSLEPYAADVPIAVCKQSITDEKGEYTACNIGRMLNSGSNSATHNTAAWTNFSQPCETANPPSVNPLICGEGTGKCPCTGEGNPQSITFGSGMGATGGVLDSTLGNLRDCFGPKTRTTPWNMTLPVVDCPGNNPGNCAKVVGVVNIDIVWVSDKDASTETEFAKEDFPPPKMENWICPSGYTRAQCWNDFVAYFKLQNVDGITATYAKKSIYFLPTCAPHEPSGGTGGENYGVLARFPVLVNAIVETPGT